MLVGPKTKLSYNIKLFLLPVTIKYNLGKDQVCFVCRPEEMLGSHIIFLFLSHTEGNEHLRQHLKKGLSNVTIPGLWHFSRFLLF